MSKPAVKMKIPAVPKAKRLPMTPREARYFQVLAHWYRYRVDPPSIEDLRLILAKAGEHRTKAPIYTALCCLETKGYVRRDDAGKFEVIP